MSEEAAVDYAGAEGWLSDAAGAAVLSGKLFSPGALLTGAELAAISDVLRRTGTERTGKQHARQQ